MRSIAKKLQDILDIKEDIKQALINKGIEVSDIFADYADEIDALITGIPILYGTLSFSGTYATATYFNEEGCRMGCNGDGEVFILVQGGSSTSYENIVFSLASAPTGIGIRQTTATYTHASNNVGNHFGCCLTGVTKKIDVAVAFNTRDATYDWVKAELTVTYSE